MYWVKVRLKFQKIFQTLYIPYDENGTWQLTVAKEMKSAGLDVDLNRLI